MRSIVSHRPWRVLALGVGILSWTACTDAPHDRLAAPFAAARPQFASARSEDVRAAIAAQERHSPGLLNVPGIVGTAVGLLPNGNAAVRVYVSRPGVGVPPALDGVPVDMQLTGAFVAYSDPTTRQRPAPPGYSVGHPSVTAGTIGARVVDAAGVVYVLSNNHVLANSNNALIGDPTWQPGKYDGGTAADQIATLSAFKAIDFSGRDNTFDAAIARSSTAELGNSTPLDDGYGTPNSRIFGDANGDGTFDDKAALLNVPVEKYGRTTKLTHGRIDAINGVVTVCYETFLGLCTKSARYVDQLIIQSSTFSGGGDSGSLIVTDDANKYPVGLLFAGSATQTIANRVDLVLSYFGVRVDGSTPPPPPTPFTDVATQSVTAPASVVQGTTAAVSVTVRNVGNQNVGAFTVSLSDATDNVGIGTQTVGSLAAGASTTLAFSWNTTGRTLGSHTLTAAHTLSDENGANNQASTATQVTTVSASSDIHIGNLTGIVQNSGASWSATVEITVHDANHQPLNGATIVGAWSLAGLNANTCTSGDLGGNGTCVVLFPNMKKSVKSVTFTVTSVTLTGRQYKPTANHDPDGSSNGTAITVVKP